MNPIQNIFATTGIRREIIYHLSERKYKPLIPKLRTYLNTDDEELFLISLNSLYKLEVRKLDKYLIDFLKKNHVKDVSFFCNTIKNCHLKESESEMIEYIKKQKGNMQISEDEIDCLKGFDKEKTEDFLIEKLNKITVQWDTMDLQERVIRKYIETFTSTHSDKARPSIHKAVFNFYGIDSNFVNHYELFKIKKLLEDSLERVTVNILKSQGYQIQGIKAVIKILNSSEMILKKNSMLKIEFVVCVKIPLKIKLIEQNINTHENQDDWIEEVKNISDTLDKINVFLSKKLNNREENVIIQEGDIGKRKGGTVTRFVNRIDSHENKETHTFPYNYWLLLQVFGNYCVENPNKKDLAILRALQRNDFVNTYNDHDTKIERRRLQEIIEEIEGKLK